MRFNHVAVACAVVMQQLVGFLWYSPAVFLRPWLAGLGRPAESFNPEDPVLLSASILGSVVFTYALAWLITLAKADSPKAGAKIGALALLGLASPVLATHYGFAGVSWVVAGIDLGMELVNAVATGAVLARWRRA